MTNEDLIRRLENVTLPDLSLESYRRELRAALLNEHSLIQAQHGQLALFRWLQSRPSLWRAILITSTVWVFIALVVTLSILVPKYQPNSVAAMAVNTVMANPEVRAALANDEMATVTVTDIGDNRLEVVVESHGGTIIIAQINARNNTITISEISYIILLGSPYETEEYITGEQQEKVINLASTDRTFRELLDKGAVISKTIAVECIISTRYFDAGETTETKETWAMVHLEFQGTRWVFLVDTKNGRVINRSSKIIPY